MVETVNGLIRGTIELKRAELILRALNTAVRNIRRVHFGLHADRMVKEVPDYPIPPLEEVDEQYAAELRRHEARKAFNRTDTSSQPAAAPAESAKTTSTPSANPAPATAASPASLPADRAEAPPRKPPVGVKRESRSSEGAQECSPRRKPWVRSTHQKEQAP